MKLCTPRVIKGWAHGRAITPARDGYFPNTNGPGRKFSIEYADPNWADAFEAFGLSPSCIEPTLGIFTGVHFLDGAFTQPHKDLSPDGFVHVRCNVMLRKPAAGGAPTIDGQPLDVEVGDLWIVLTSLEVHGSTPISGGERVIKSFGGLVPLEQIQSLTNELERPNV